MDKTQDALKLAREALELAQDNLRDHGDNCFLHDEGEYNRCFCGKDSLSNHLQSVVEKLDEALAEQPAQQQEPVSLKSLAQKAGINLPETYIPTMDDAIAAGDSVLMNEQAALLRECRAALDSLIAQKPTLAGLLCGSTTLGNLKAELGAYRPQGVFGTSPPASKPLTDEQIDELARATFDVVQEMPDYQVNGDTWDREFARAIEAAHGIKGGA